MRTIAPLILVVGLLAGCGSDVEKPRATEQRESIAPPSPALVNRGEQLFEQHCKRCHAVNGSGGDRGIDLSRAGLRYTPLRLRSLIAHGNVTTPEMRRIQKLPEEDQTAIVIYLSTLR